MQGRRYSEGQILFKGDNGTAQARYSGRNSLELFNFFNFLQSRIGSRFQEAWLPRFLPGKRPLMIPNE